MLEKEPKEKRHQKKKLIRRLIRELFGTQGSSIKNTFERVHVMNRGKDSALMG